MRKKIILAVAITFLTVLSSFKLVAQTLEDVNTAYNAGRELSTTDIKAAVAKMNEALALCAKVGPTADTLKASITKVLPNWQYNVANTYLVDKNYIQALPAFEKSLALAKQYDDEVILTKSKEVLVKAYTFYGNDLVQIDSLDKALTMFDNALKYDPEYSKALFTKGLVYKKKGNNDKMLEYMELAITSAAKTDDTVLIQAAKNYVGYDAYKKGLAAYNKRLYPAAVSELNKALAYNFKTKDLYYVLAVSNNILKKYDEAIEAANAGLTMDEQTDLKMARYYCEIAKAYEGKKDVANACANYKKSVFGGTAAFANDKLKNVLKCQ